MTCNTTDIRANTCHITDIYRIFHNTAIANSKSDTANIRSSTRHGTKVFTIENIGILVQKSRYTTNAIITSVTSIDRSISTAVVNSCIISCLCCDATTIGMTVNITMEVAVGNKGMVGRMRHDTRHIVAAIDIAVHVQAVDAATIGHISEEGTIVSSCIIRGNINI